MKKYLFIATWLLTLCSMAVANPIDQAEARQKAQAFMSRKGKTVQAIPHRAPHQNGNTATCPLYIFNAEAGAGFVVVSGDDRTEAILGYVDNGSYQEDTAPENMKAWLQGYADVIASLDNPPVVSDQDGAGNHANYPSPPDAAEPVSMDSSMPLTVAHHPAIAPMVVTKWNQGNVNNPTYNQYCPSLNSLYAVTGCVATAMAQIMYYHRWPQEATNSIPSYDFTLTNNDEKYGMTSEELPPFVFDWDAMLPIYTGNNSRDDYEAVARLMQYCGYAVEMEYGINGSGAFSENVVKALHDYFDYDGNTRFVSRSQFTASEWDALLYEELSAGRPIYYSGSSTGGGHAFVCDGYDGEGFYHINWGWGGSGDGFFKISVLNPHVSGIGGSTTSDGYAMGQAAVVGIGPNQGNPVYESPVCLTTTSMTYSGSVINFDAFNMTGRELCVLFGLGHYVDGELTADYFYYYDGLLPGTGWSRLGIDVYDMGLPDGTYNIYPISVECDEEAEPLRSVERNGSENLYLVVTIANGAVSITEPFALSVNGISLLGNGIADMTQEISVSLTNQGAEFYGNLYLFASTDDNLGDHQAMTIAVVESGGKEDVSFYFTPPYAATWHIWICTDEDGNNIIGAAEMVFTDPPTGEVTLAIDALEIVSHEQTTATVTISNTGDVGYYRELWAFIFKNGEQSYVGYQSTGALGLEPGTSQTFTFTFDDLEVGAYYNIGFYHFKHFDDSNVTTTGFSEWFQVTEATPPVLDFDTEKARLEGMADSLSVNLNNLKAIIDVLMLQSNIIMEIYETLSNRIQDHKQQYAEILNKMLDSNIPDEKKQELNQSLELLFGVITDSESTGNNLYNSLINSKMNIEQLGQLYEPIPTTLGNLYEQFASATTLDDLNAIEAGLNALQLTYSQLAQSVETEQQNVIQNQADMNEWNQDLVNIRHQLQEAEAMVDCEIARQEVMEALDELPLLAPILGYDADMLDQMRTLVSNWNEKYEALTQHCETLQQWLESGEKGHTLTAEERASILQELSDLNTELTNMKDNWSFILQINDEYVSVSDNYDNMYQALLTWIETTKSSLQEASTRDEIEALRQQVADKREEIVNTPIPDLPLPSIESMEPEATEARLQAIDNRLNEIEALLNKVPTDINHILSQSGGRADVWTLSGQLVRRQATSLSGLPAGIYIVNGQKVAVRSTTTHQ